jgi:hypothetical protein
VAVSPDMPEEYGFILRNAGYPPNLSPNTLHYFIEICKKVQFISASDRPLLLKNPWDFPNFIYLKGAFPAAKFIFIHRYPIHVINSQLRALRVSLSSKNIYNTLISRRYAQLVESPIRFSMARLFWSLRFGLGTRILTRRMRRGTTYFLKNIASLPKADYLSLKYEDLCRDPESQITRILQFLGLNAAACPAYDPLIAPRQLSLLPEIARRQTYILRKLHPYCVYFGY